MHRGITVGNKICARWEEQRRQDLHRERIRNMRPLTDTSEPMALQMDHIRNNYKREQMLEERYSEIDRENRILLKKMSDIMKSTGSATTPRTMEPSGPQSLNRDLRKKELLRITRENQHILRRIQQAQPIYNHIEWEAEHRKNQSYLSNCAEYPRVFVARRDYTPRSELVPIQAEDVNERVPVTARSGVSQEPKMLPAIDGATEDGGMKYVLKEGRRIGDITYLVEMSTDGGDLNISAYDADSQTTLEFVVKAKLHRKIFRESNGDYSLLAQRLRIATDEHGARLLLEDEEPPPAASMPATAREPLGASGLIPGQIARGPHSSPPTARVEGGRAAKAAEGVRDRTAAYMQMQQGPPAHKSPSPPGASPAPTRSPPPARTSPGREQEAESSQPVAAAPRQPEAPSGPAPKKSGRNASKGQGKRKAPGDEELDADTMVAANSVASGGGDGPLADDSDNVVSQAGTVGSAGFPPGSAGSAWTCEVDLTNAGDPQVRLRGLTPDTGKQ